MNLFYDVPLVFDVSAPATVQGRVVAGGRMAYAIFDCPFAAMSYAARAYRPYRGLRPIINRREWDKGIFERARILDMRENDGQSN